MFLIFSFKVYILKYMKDEVKINDKIDKNIIKKFLFLLKLTIIKNERLFYTIISIYICPNFYSKT